MSHLVYKRDYPGLPEDFLEDLRRVAQATVTSLYDASRLIWPVVHASPTHTQCYEVGSGCTISADMATPSIGQVDLELSMQRIVVKNRLGWWSVLQWGQPHNDEIMDFWAFGSDRRHSIVIDDWMAHQADWGESRCFLYLFARRLNDSGGWYSPCHHLDHKHPLLSCLMQTVALIETPRDQ